MYQNKKGHLRISLTIAEKNNNNNKSALDVEVSLSKILKSKLLLISSWPLAWQPHGRMCV